MKRRTFIGNAGVAGLFTFFRPSQILHIASTYDNTFLEKSFRSPSQSSYPQVIWFWMNGNVSKEGITLDLEAMKRIGISGVFNFDAATGIPKGKVAYLSEEWKEMKRHAVKEAARLGLSFTIHNCPGWSASGGPWITPELAMQQVTWSEEFISGGEEINITLPKPPNKLNYYKDIAVLAFPSLQGEGSLPMLVNSISTGNGHVELNDLVGENAKGVQVWPTIKDSKAWLQFEFKEPYEVRFINFFISAKQASEAYQPTDINEKTSVDLEASDDGVHFKLVTTINTGLASGLTPGNKFITYDIPVTKAKYFRITSNAVRLYRKVQFSGVARLKNFMEKAGYRFMFSGEGMSDTLSDNNQEIPVTSIINHDSIVDITSFIDDEGVLKWKAPTGNWTILRIGYTPIESLNHAAPEGGVGLECDKFSDQAFDFHFRNMMKYLEPVIEPLLKTGKLGLEIDSYEAGPQNWTPSLPKEFQNQRKYSLLHYLPVLTGRVVTSIDTTDRFLWDFRRTLADLMANNYYGKFAKLCRKKGITSYVQPYDRGPFNEMQIGTKANVNLGEFWYGLFSVLQSNLHIRRTPRLVSSIAHINGKKIVGAEAFTSEPESSRWQEYPFALKEAGDKAFIEGINMLVIHRYVHQPHPTAMPGMTLGPYGIHFERTNTWWNESKAWISYIARCQGLLQSGIPFADLAYLTADDANLYTKVNADELTPAPPKGYDYDLIDSGTILNKVSVKNNQITLPGGINYKVLIIQNYKAITIELLSKIEQLVKQGMILVGAKPERSLGLSNYQDHERSFNQITNELWGDEKGNEHINRQVGNGYVYWNKSLDKILHTLQIKPDFEYTSRSGDAPISYKHRVMGKTHIYFISNARRTFEDIVCSFRVPGLQPELWDATSGSITPLSIYEVEKESVRVPIHMEPYGSCFVIFRNPVSSVYYQALLKDQKNIVSTKHYSYKEPKSYKDITDNFTIVFQAKPEMNIMLNSSLFMGNVKDPWTDYYAIFPDSGKALYGEGHATCGIAVGRNGVAVWEKAEGRPILVLSAPVSISGWSAIALVYKEGVPAIYVNGKLIRKGNKSMYIIHPNLGDNITSEGVSYYNGDMSKPQLLEQTISESQLSQLTKETIEVQEEPVISESILNNKPAFLIWQNGNYLLKNNQGNTFSFEIKDIDETMILRGPWQVYFPQNSGAPKEITLPQLISIHKHPDNNVKYFSGTLTYEINFNLPAHFLQGNKSLFLDLGRVEVIASVFVNGKDLGTLWKRPYKLDISGAVNNEDNHLLINVTNLWPNRLIGDEQLPDPDHFISEGYEGSSEYTLAGGIEQLPQWYLERHPKPTDGRIAFTTWKHYTKDSPLLESGLIGPVRLQTAILKFIKEDV